MIREDLVAERVAIDGYREMIAWFGTGDPTTRRMLEGILAMEEEPFDRARWVLRSPHILEPQSGASRASSAASRGPPSWS